MAATMHIDVVSAEQQLYSGEAEFVTAPAEMGEVGVYPHHAPLLTRMKPGTVKIRVPNQAKEEVIYVSGGVLEIQPGSITVLSDTAIRGQDLDEARALEAKGRAEEAMRNRTSDMDYARAQAELAEAIAQIAAIEKLRKLGH
jgi:F-type H+-transporting ATPase subunit epsilon